jgi:hypothetical protein
MDLMLPAKNFLMVTLASASLAFMACSDGGENNGNENENVNQNNDPDAGAPVVPQYSVSGTVVDFLTGAPIAGEASVTVVGIYPVPDVQVTGANFTIPYVPGASVFDLKVGGAGYEYTFSASVQVGNGDITGIEAKAVSVAFVDAMELEFGRTFADGIVIAQLKDDGGNYLANINANEFYLNDATPNYLYFLDDNKDPYAAGARTYNYGYAIFFDVPDGYANITASPNSTYLMTMTPARVEAGVVTLATVYGGQTSERLLRQ